MVWASGVSSVVGWSYNRRHHRRFSSSICRGEKQTLAQHFFFFFQLVFYSFDHSSVFFSIYLSYIRETSFFPPGFFLSLWCFRRLRHFVLFPLIINFNFNFVLSFSFPCIILAVVELSFNLFHHVWTLLLLKCGYSSGALLAACATQLCKFLVVGWIDETWIRIAMHERVDL